MKHLIQLTLRLQLAFALVLGLTAPLTTVPALASTGASTNAACEGIGLTGASCNANAASNDLNQLVKTIVNILSVIVGIAAVIMIIISGLKYVTSGGDSGNIATAKSTLIYAIVGIVIVALAQFIVRFVLNAF